MFTDLLRLVTTYGPEIAAAFIGATTGTMAVLLGTTGGPRLINEITL